MKDNADAPSTKLSINDTLQQVLRVVLRYAIVLFVILVTGTYGFVLYRITSAHDVTPSQADIDAKLQKSATPRIDPQVVQQMQSLQDNSVNVKSLFDAARSNPFNE